MIVNLNLIRSLKLTYVDLGLIRESPSDVSFEIDTSILTVNQVGVHLENDSKTENPLQFAKL